MPNTAHAQIDLTVGQALTADLMVDPMEEAMMLMQAEATRALAIVVVFASNKLFYWNELSV